MTAVAEKRLLQLVVAILSCSPLGFGFLGMLNGVELAGGEAARNLATDSHLRYLSGIFFGLGLMAASCVPGIETKTARFRWVVLLVVIGGLARLHGFFSAGVPQSAMFWAIFAELVATPLVGLWQRRVARQWA